MRSFTLLLTVASLMGAQERARTSNKTDVGTGVQDATVDYFDSVADYFKNSRRAVMAIRDKGIPEEEIPAVLYVARNSSASPNQVIEARKSGRSWSDIAQEHKVPVSGKGLVEEANVSFLAAYHGRSAEQVRAMHAKGASWIDINQEFRRAGMPKKTSPVPAEPKR